MDTVRFNDIRFGVEPKVKNAKKKGKYIGIARRKLKSINKNIGIKKNPTFHF